MIQKHHIKATSPPLRPLFVADWARVMMIHYRVEPSALQPFVPFELDTFGGSAWVSLVAFTMRGLRPYVGGRIGAMMTRPIATHPFLNIRTYVRHGDMRGIYFLAEYLPNVISVHLGPFAYGLPYRRGSLDYRHDHERGNLRGSVRNHARDARLHYSAAIDEHADFQPAARESLDAFLLERYLCFTQLSRGPTRVFRVAHEPWSQVRIDPLVHDATLIAQTGDWFNQANMTLGHYAPGLDDVIMGMPQWL
jgi:uncharacterized protein YqjF (DUF2071 family)